jgi:nucleotidyltransferase/DNA polymerase involved in DNA repair
VAKTIRQQIHDELHLIASAGMPPNKVMAKIASDWRKPDGLFVIQPSEVNAFLASLPIGRILGVGKVTEYRLKEIGATTVGRLQSINQSILEEKVRPIWLPTLRAGTWHRSQPCRCQPADEVDLGRGHAGTRCVSFGDVGLSNFAEAAHADLSLFH